MSQRSWRRIGGLTALLFCGGAGGQNQSAYSYLFTRTPHQAVAQGSECPSEGAALMMVAGGAVRPFAPAFAASAQAAVSFDGARVLFSGKQTRSDSWQIWEAALAGGAPRRITHFAEDAVAPQYMPNGRIVYARRAPDGFQIETSLISGAEANRLTYGPGDHIPTAVLRDGRVLFEAPHAGSAGRDLFTVYADGSGVEAYRCDHGKDRRSGAELSGGDIVFATGERLARFTSARATQVDTPGAKGEFRGRIAEGGSGEWLVAYRPGAGQPFGIYRWRAGQGEPVKLATPAGADATEPVLLRAHAVPKRHPSSLGNREGANLLCLNAYASRSAKIPSGTVAAVRVWALGDSGAATSLGQAPVEQDGSFYVQTPSERAIRFELLDRAGKTVAAEKGWFWARRGEQRVCVGCHAGPERAPENAVPAVLLRTTDPVKMIHPITGASK